MGTPLYERTVAFDYGDAERGDLMRMVWEPTPWMLEVKSGSPDAETYRELQEWCRDCFGDEAFPIHGKAGSWQRGTATVCGWTWFGFASEAAMTEFVSAWRGHIQLV